MSEERLRDTVSALAGPGSRHGVESPERHGAAAELIASRMAAAGCDVVRQEFEIPQQATARTGLNVIGTLPPNASIENEAPGPAVLAGCHYDTVPGSPGADDNASGVAGMLECLDVLAGARRSRAVVFAAFDAEEGQSPSPGLLGSAAYVAALLASSPPQPVPEAYILEMIGYTAPPGSQRFPFGFPLLFPRAYWNVRRRGFAGDAIAVLSNSRSRRLSRNFEWAARQWGGKLEVTPIAIPRWMPVLRNFRRSDHAPFWGAGAPAVMIGDTANFRNPNYHRPTDTPDTLDYTFMANVTRALAGAIACDVVTV